MTPKESLNDRLIRTAATVIVFMGAIFSEFLTFKAGHKNASLILPALFLIWVLSPFAMLLYLLFKIKPEMKNGLTTYIVMIGFSLLSVIAYSGILNPAGAKPAAVFIFTPLIAWVLLIVWMAARPKAKQP